MSLPLATATPPSSKRPGAKPRNGVRATARIWLRVTPEERAALEQVAADNQSTVGAVVREAVNEFVSDYGERRVFPRRPDARRL